MIERGLLYNEIGIQYILIYQKRLNVAIYITGSKVRIMPKKNKTESCCPSKNQPVGCCTVESVVSVDDRGQMVLPKELRQKAHINAGDKLAAVAMEKDGKICCLSLIKVNEIEPMVKKMLGPIMKEIL
ncbi:MAG TPA: HgcAB-associated protein [Candidatus Thermoplasmatota archaeon]|nr:HgcAB-associated protein [Candidatus Thermoplasmatota archaeon]